MELLPGVPSDFTPKSFWERKEGTTGMVVSALLLLGGGWALYHLLPFIITLAQNGIIAIVMLLILAGLIYVITDKRFRNLVWYMYKSAMRALTKLWTEVDPIGILNNYVSHLKDQAEIMSQQIGNLRGQMRSLKNAIDRNASMKKEALQMAGQARKQNRQNVFVLKARKAGRLEESNMTLQALYTKLEVLYRVLNKMYETALILVEDLEDEVDVKTREYPAIKASYSAFKSALRIIQGDRDKREVFDITMEYLAEDYGRKVGEIEHFMDISHSIIDTIDVQNGVYEEEALKKLEEWENKSDSILLGDNKRLLIAQAESTTNHLDLEAPLPDRETVVAKREKDDKDKTKVAEAFFEQ